MSPAVAIVTAGLLSSTEGYDMDNTPEAILKAALAREHAAHRFYADLLERHSRIEPVRDLLQELKDEEYRHVKMVEARLSDLEAGRL
jgi:rubrerythrin